MSQISDEIKTKMKQQQSLIALALLVSTSQAVGMKTKVRDWSEERGEDIVVPEDIEIDDEVEGSEEIDELEELDEPAEDSEDLESLDGLEDLGEGSMAFNWAGNDFMNQQQGAPENTQGQAEPTY